MAKMTRRRLIRLPAPSSGQVISAPDREAEKQNREAREKIRRRYFPDVIVTSHEGKQVRFYDDLIRGKTVVINMMYAECEGVCPGITANLVKVQKLFGDQMGRDIFFYSLTLKPQEDDPDALDHYAKMHGVGPGWLFLTGKPSDMELLRVKLGFTYPDPKLDKDTSQHIGNIRYGNEPEMLWAACPGQASPDWIVRSISWVTRPREKRT
jgi:protein SCO1/2